MENASHTLLLICLTHELAEAQRILLEEHGYQVLVASDLREVDQLSKNTRLSCAILGADLGPPMKQNIAALLCDNRPAIAIVEEYTTCPVLPDAEHVLVGTPPPDFLAAIDDLLLPYGRRHTEHLRRKARLLVNMARELVETAKYIVRQNRQTRAGSRRRRDKRVRADRKNDRKQSG